MDFKRYNGRDEDLYSYIRNIVPEKTSPSCLVLVSEAQKKYNDEHTSKKQVIG